MQTAKKNQPPSNLTRGSSAPVDIQQKDKLIAHLKISKSQNVLLAKHTTEHNVGIFTLREQNMAAGNDTNVWHCQRDNFPKFKAIVRVAAWEH